MTSDSGNFKVVGLNHDGLVIFEFESGERYLSGETLEEFGADNLTEDEKRIPEVANALKMTTPESERLYRTLFGVFQASMASKIGLRSQKSINAKLGSMIYGMMPEIAAALGNYEIAKKVARRVKGQ